MKMRPIFGTLVYTCLILSVLAQEVLVLDDKCTLEYHACPTGTHQCLGTLKLQTADNADTSSDVNLCVPNAACVNLDATDEGTYDPDGFVSYTRFAGNVGGTAAIYVARDETTTRCTAPTTDVAALQFMLDDVWRWVMAGVYAVAAIAGMLTSFGFVQLITWLAKEYNW